MSSVFDFLKNLKNTAFSIGINDIIEIILMAVILYKIFAWMKDKRAWVVVKGLVAVILLFLIAEVLQLNTILYLAQNSLDVIVIALIVVFQRELRNVLENIGKKNKLFNIFADKDKSSGEFDKHCADQLISAALELGRTKTGALIVIECEDLLSEYVTSGIDLNADISEQLLINIFEHNTPLHDGAVIIRGGKISSATSYLPLTNRQDISKAYGTRHRAAIGVSEVTDSLSLIVSEETGHISAALKGELYENIPVSRLKGLLYGIVGDTEDRNSKTMKSILPWKNKEQKDEK